VKKVCAVIGLHYGDEGKGQVTNDLLEDADPGKSLVVRFSGGANAGHTVVHQGVRHVFSHFGSGTLRGVATYWGQDAIANPILFNKEWRKLEKLGITPKVFVSPRSLVTFPVDMLANQREEKRRAESGEQHGTCGVGIHKTVMRSAVLPITVGELSTFPPVSLVWAQEVAEDIHWGERDGTDRLTVPLGKMSLFFDEVREFLSHITIASAFLPEDTLLFEGSQGVRLSATRVADGYDGRYLTEANTDLTNLKHLPYPVDVYGVSRPYLTRHGAGPLPNEVPTPPFPGIIERTNVLNPWQGAFRYGLLTETEIQESWRVLCASRGQLQGKLTHVTTCADQLSPFEYAEYQGKLSILDGIAKAEDCFGVWKGVK